MNALLSYVLPLWKVTTFISNIIVVAQDVGEAADVLHGAEHRSDAVHGIQPTAGAAPRLADCL